MSRRCADCRGRGRWQERQQTTDEETLLWYECNTCHGTGVKRDDDDPEDDFDLAGSGVTEFDDD